MRSGDHITLSCGSGVQLRYGVNDITIEGFMGDLRASAGLDSSVLATSVAAAGAAVIWVSKAHFKCGCGTLATYRQGPPQAW